MIERGSSIGGGAAEDPEAGWLGDLGRDEEGGGGG